MAAGASVVSIQRFCSVRSVALVRDLGRDAHDYGTSGLMQVRSRGEIVPQDIARLLGWFRSRHQGSRSS